jgi:hypothetical protein
MKSLKCYCGLNYNPWKTHRSKSHSQYLWMQPYPETGFLKVEIEVKWGQMCESQFRGLYSALGPSKRWLSQNEVIRLTLIPYKKENTRDVHMEKRPCEDLATRHPSASQGEKPQEKLNLLTPWSWTFSLQNCKKINFCCLNQRVCGILFWQP